MPAQTIFDNLPLEPIYTLGLDVPSSWLVRPREAFHDLDNIQLAKLAPIDRLRGIEAIYELDFLVIEGHAREEVSNQPARGLQLLLLGIDSAPVAETLVVATLGYMQFRAAPGVFQLVLREGRGRDIYVMESVGNEGWTSPSISQSGADVTLTSFEGLTLYPRVRRRPGMERVDVLDEFIVPENEPKGIFSDVASRCADFCLNIYCRIHVIITEYLLSSSQKMSAINHRSSWMSDVKQISTFLQWLLGCYTRFVSLNKSQ